MNPLIISVIAACLLLVAAQSYELVPFTAVVNATERRAVCLGGTPGGYYYSAGSGDGAKSWLLYLMGGGWCETIDECRTRLDKPYGIGSESVNFTGILSQHKEINPDFYNWNRVYLVYCDGSSFLGDSELDVSGVKFQFRGSRIFDAVVEDLSAIGLSSGENVILSGRSAGALATILHCDGFHASLPNVGTLKCLSDAGFFIRAENVANAKDREQYFNSTIMLHNISSFLPATCTKRIDPGLCLFPENLVGDVQTPLFLLNSAFDYFQVEYRLVSKGSPDWGRWDSCVRNMTCTSSDIQLIKDFGDAFFNAIRNIPYNPTRGMFINTCYVHSGTYVERYWSPNSTVKLGNMTIPQAFAKWFFSNDTITLITPETSITFC